MRSRMNMFVKMLLFFILVMSVTLLLYGRLYRHDIEVITAQLTSTDLNHLSFFAQQIDNNVDQLSANAYTLQRDPTIRDYEQINQLSHLIDRNQTILSVLEKLSLQTSSSNLSNRITLYNVQRKEALSSDSEAGFDDSTLSQPLREGWSYISNEQSNGSNGEFRMLLADPADFAAKPLASNMVLEVRFGSSDIVKMLEEYQSQRSGDTFLYREGEGFVYQSGSDLRTAEGLLGKIGNLRDKQTASNVVTFEGERYLVSSAWSSSLGWHVIHYSPLDHILAPLESSRTSFITASMALLGLSIVFSLMMFRHIQRPISSLLRAVNRLKEGQWSARIQIKTNNEFSVLNGAFNAMAEQIQSLIERVYQEQLRAKDAFLKQLQSQINPHFLYNCLFFIKSKAGVGDTDAVTAMALNLGEYYRYITRLDHSMTTVGEELKLLDSYLAIQNLRKQRITYEIEVPDSLQEERIPRLLIQPLVENSIVHGIEKKAGSGTIRISGRTDGDLLEFVVEDSGAGMTDESISLLLDKLDAPVREETSCGLWNVQQRLKHQFGPASGLYIHHSELGGVRATLRIDRKEG